MPFVSPALRHRPRPPLAVGLLVALGCLVLETGVGLLLQRVFPLPSLALLYLVGVVLVASVWGVALGFVMAAASTLAYHFFLAPAPLPLFFSRYPDVAMLVVFLAMALLGSALARLARRLSVEVEAREEADLCADLARLLLHAPEPRAVLPAAAEKLARALGLPSAWIRLEAAARDDEHVVFPLRGPYVGACVVVPARTSRRTIRRLRERVVPALEVLLEAACEREEVAGALRASRDQFARVVEEQAALRRLATLVAHAAPSTEVFAAVAREAGNVLGVLHTVVARYEPDGTVVGVGSWIRHSGLSTVLPVASRWEAQEKGTVTELVWRTWAPGRVDLYDGDGKLSTLLRERGITASVGCPIIVGRSLWGLMIASANSAHPLPADTEKRMTDFTELTAAAIANAQSDADLRASRARVVAAADEARRRIERDLHDGTQQRLVAIGLELRGAASGVPDGHDDLRRRLTGSAKALDDALIDLQELSRGLHPAALAKGGLNAGLAALTRRSALPVDLEVDLPCRLADRLELTAYFVVSEALTNAAKHAAASHVRVVVDVYDARVRVSVRDDGGGGADPTRGSGLVGLTDRVEAVGGTLSVTSPPGEGTSLLAELPFEPAR
jgi:signal transduction histidine kinase